MDGQMEGRTGEMPFVGG